MKKFLCILLVALCFISTFNFNVAQAEKGTVVFTNGNFESFTKVPSAFGGAKYTPNNWIMEGNVPLSDIVNKETASFYDGASSLCVKNSGSDLVLLGDFVSINGGANYHFGYKIKDAENSGVNAQITIRSFDKDNNLIKESESKVFKSSNVWTEVFIEVTLPNDAVYIRPIIEVYAAQYSQSGTSKVCYVDAMSGCEIEKQIFTVKDGASLRLVKETPGIRFYSEIGKSIYDEYKLKYQKVNVGMLITPTENLENVGDFTAEELSKKGILFIEIPATTWANQSTAEVDGVYGFYCALVNILPKNICRKFSARAYISYEDKGKTYFVYSNYDQLVNSRSVNEIAILALEELDIYDENQKEIINYYAKYNS